MKKIFTFLIYLSAVICCDKINRYPDVDINTDTEKPEQEKPEEEKPPVAGTITPFTTASLNDKGISRILAWQSLIQPFVSNDTGEDMSIKDKPASWGNHHEYRLMNTGNDNFFRVKTETVSKMK